MGVAGTETHFYYHITRKIVGVFGAFFNNIVVARDLSDGTLVNAEKVPISYGPRSKFLARINAKDGGEISIKLPRMSFEIAGISYDASSKLNSINKRKICKSVNDDGIGGVAFIPVPYKLDFSLSIFARTQDDVLQVLEQILPVFSPSYTVTVKDIQGPGTLTDVPFKLNDISMSDEYEGDWIPARPIVYTLNFDAKVSYLGPIDSRTGVIERVATTLNDDETEKFLGSKSVVTTDSGVEYISNVDPADLYEVKFDEESPLPEFEIGENLIGTESGHAGLVKDITIDSIIIHQLEDMYNFDESYGIGEILSGDKSGVSAPFISIKLYNEEES